MADASYRAPEQRYHRIYTIEVKGRGRGGWFGTPLGLKSVDDVLLAVVKGLDDFFKRRTVKITKVVDL